MKSLVSNVYKKPEKYKWCPYSIDERIDIPGAADPG